MQETAAVARSRPQAARERTLYGVTGARQSVFALGLLVLLPFLAGGIVMLVRRLADGLYFEVAALLLVLAALSVIAMLLLFELVFALRARLELGRTALRYTLPRNGGPSPLLSYDTQDIPYHAVRTVELRREVFGGRVAPVMLRALVLKTKDNRELVLGHALDGYDDPDFPYARIGEQIAQRAALPLIDQRTLWYRSRAERALGYISAYDTQTYILDPLEGEKLNTTHRRLALGLASLLAAFVILGVLADLAVS